MQRPQECSCLLCPPSKQDNQAPFSKRGRNIQKVSEKIVNQFLADFCTSLSVRSTLLACITGLASPWDVCPSPLLSHPRLTSKREGAHSLLPWFQDSRPLLKFRIIHPLVSLKSYKIFKQYTCMCKLLCNGLALATCLKFLFTQQLSCYRSPILLPSNYFIRLLQT